MKIRVIQLVDCWYVVSICERPNGRVHKEQRLCVLSPYGLDQEAFAIAPEWLMNGLPCFGNGTITISIVSGQTRTFMVKSVPEGWNNFQSLQRE